jgi:ATP-dependent RNA helicase DeaD
MSSDSPDDAVALPTFDALSLSPELRRAIDDLGYTHPTPVQRAVFEPARRGKDLVVQARTGTGKTAAFGLPLIDSIVRRTSTQVQALALCPTRELALQVTREIEALSKYRGVKSAAVYGGAPMPRQVEAIQNGAQIVVGTPGRVLDHLRRKTFDPSSIRVMVIDESDEMLSMGFLPQITDILSYLPESRQTLLFSATLPPDIRRIAETRLKNPEFITLSSDQVGALEIRHFVYLNRADKLSELVQVIETENPESAIVFCNTRDETKRVAQALQQQGYASDWLNSDLAQNDREKVMAATRRGDLRFLVCTDVASRGIDISHLSHVINFDFPESPEAYVHRTGRTGRAGRTGTAISLIEPGDIGNLYLLRLTYKLRPIERELPSARELKTRAEADLVTMFVEAFGSKKPHADDLALSRRLLSHERADVVIAGLLRDHLGARPDAQEEATAARRAKAPQKVPDPVPVPVDRSSNGVAREAKPAQEARAPREERRPRERSRDERPRDERPRDERPRDERPRDERPRDERPRDERPRDERPRDERPRDRQRDSRQRDDRTLPSAPERDSERGRDRRATSSVDPGLIEVRDVSTDSPRRETIQVEARVSKLENNTPPEELANDLTAEGQDREPVPGIGVAEIYVSVGRRDGAKPSDFQALLAECGVLPEHTDYIRVRHRHAFVGVLQESLAKAVAALNGATIAGKQAFAEPARRV